MDIEVLRTFILLSHYKNFSKTAEFLHVVQSTVSLRIQELEKIIGKQLFIRNNREVELSKEGALFLPYAKRIIELYEEGVIKLNSTPFFEQHLSIGSIDSILRYNLSQVFKEFLIRFPSISIKLVTGNSPEIIQLLLDGVIDMGFVVAPPRLSRFEVISCFEEEIILAVSPKHKISKLPSISVNELVKHQLLFANFGGNFMEWMERIIPSWHPFRLQVDPASLLIPFIKEGLGPALIIRSAVKKELISGELLSIPMTGKDLPPKWKVYAVFDKDKKEHRAIQRFFDLIK